MGVLPRLAGCLDGGESVQKVRSERALKAVHEETPQLEDGYTRLANELFDAILSFPFSARQLKVLMSIIRKTYGYNKKRDDMSASQIGAACGLARNHVSTVLGELVDLKVIKKQPGKFGMMIEVNKKCGEWVNQEGGKGSPDLGLGSPKLGLVPKKDSGSPDLGQVDSPDLGHTKDNLPKDNQQKTGEPANPEFEEAWRLYPKRDGGNSKADAMKAWNSRIKGGVAAADLLAGVKRYAAYCRDKNMVGTRFVKQAATFFGPGAHYAESWGQAAESESWWMAAGFEKEWKAINAGCTPVSAHLWRDGQKAEA